MTDPQSARLLEAVDVLRRHNEWRRCDDGSTPMVHHLGRAIDTVVELVPELIRKAEANPCMARRIKERP